MFSLVDFFKQVVTPENVNRIPSDLSAPDFPDSFAARLFEVCKKARYGFMHFALMSYYWRESVAWLLCNFSSSIDFENMKLPESITSFVNDLEEYQERKFAPLLQWCVIHSYTMFYMFLEAGVRSGAEEAFKEIVMGGGGPTHNILEFMLQKGIGINYTLPPLYVQTTKLIQKYKSRRTRCDAVVVRLLGLLRFKKTKYFSGLDPRLLKQMVVTPVFQTRYSKCWDSIETKKLEI